MKNIKELLTKKEAKENEDKLLAVKIPPALFDRISKIAKACPQGVTKRDVVMAMLTDGCDEFDKQKREAKAADKAA